jgi:membrane protease YdiL (CAAX protease family)
VHSFSLQPLVLFVSLYVATLFVLTWLRVPWQWSGLTSVVAATIGTIALFERGQWRLGFFVPPPLALRDFAIGVTWGIALIGGCALLVVVFTEVRHERGSGFPWLELAAVYAPAVVHEELLFRGYFFQKLLHRHRAFALVFVALLFAALHARNTSVTALALVNIFLGGLLLGLAYERYYRLWFPIGLHLSWNLMSGPILGHEVSGYEGLETLFVERGGGSWWLTGGDFGIEGSLLMTAVEIAALIVLARRISSARRTFLTREGA